MSRHRAIVISGVGRYADPWHPFDETSAALVQQLGQLDVAATIHPSDGGAVDTGGLDLLVVNSGGGSTRDDDEQYPEPIELRQSVLGFTGAGGPTLVVHTGSNTFYETGQWADLIGGSWVPGTSMHPPLGQAQVQVVDDGHPISAGRSVLQIRDERYCYLDVAPTARVLITHEHDDVEHALVWVHTRDGLRVVHDALGHDGQAYAGTDRRELLRREVDWLLHRPRG